MKLWSIILLFGNYFFRWTTAVSFKHETYFITMNGKTLENITVTSDTLNVDLSNFHIEYIENNALDELTNIESLDLSRNELWILNPLTFSKLKNLKLLSLAYTSILAESLGKLFIGLDKLEVLNLAHNNIYYMNRNSFMGIPKSTNIIIEGNSFEKITTEPVMQGKRVRRSEDAFLKKLSRRSVEPYYIKVCQTVDGIVESVGVIGEDDSFGDCTSALETFHNGRATIKFNERTVTGFQGSWFGQNLSHDSIDLSSNFITEITSVIFDDLPSSVSHIDLSSNYISKIEDGAFEKLNLTALNVSDNKLNDMAFVRTLPTSIKELNCGRNLISEIPPDSFRRLENLEVFVMRDNKLKEIGSKIFEFQKNLRSLDFSFNQIRRVESDTFPDSTRWLKIDLSHNEIAEISRHSFNKESLRELQLGFNKIENITRDTFNKNWKLLQLNSNKINRIEPGSFSNMTCNFLDLSDNNIRENEISNGAFDGSAIKDFDLSHNLMSKIDRETFKSFSVLRSLWLRNNPITRIEKGALTDMKRISTLDLSGTRVTELRKGALFGLSTKRKVSVLITGMPLRVIQGGIFDYV